MTKENNKMQVDIENLIKQNVNDLLSIKELYKRIEELGEKTKQFKYIDNTLVKKIKKEYENFKKEYENFIKEYENFKKIILDENIQIELNSKIEETKNEQVELNSKIEETKTELNEVSSQMDTKTNLTNKRIAVINESGDVEGVIDLANFAGQGTDIRDIMAKLHNYTDSDLMWLDNVGEGNTILRLNNSRNPNRRLDKDETYVGNGNYLVCGKHKEDGSIYYILLEIDENMNFNFNNAGAIEFINKKLNSDGEPAFIIKTPSGLHKHLLQLQTASDNRDVFIFGCHPSGNLAQIEVGEKMSNGLNIIFPNIDKTQHLKYGNANNPYTVPNVIVKAFAPTSITPHFIGQMFVNTIDNSVYMGTEMVSGGWTKLSN